MFIFTVIVRTWYNILCISLYVMYCYIYIIITYTQFIVDNRMVYIILDRLQSVRAMNTFMLYFNTEIFDFVFVFFFYKLFTDNSFSVANYIFHYIIIRVVGRLICPRTRARKFYNAMQCEFRAAHRL